jgi:hypothetical protein
MRSSGEYHHKGMVRQQGVTKSITLLPPVAAGLESRQTYGSQRAPALETDAIHSLIAFTLHSSLSSNSTSLYLSTPAIASLRAAAQDASQNTTSLRGRR